MLPQKASSPGSLLCGLSGKGPALPTLTLTPHSTLSTYPRPVLALRGMSWASHNLRPQGEVHSCQDRAVWMPFAGSLARGST